MKSRRVVEVEVGIYAGFQVFHCFVTFKVMLTGTLACFLRKKMEIRELTKNDLPSLLELYIQLSENNKNITLEKSKEIWIKQIQQNPNIKYFGPLKMGKSFQPAIV